ncbi:MAG: hypothetical protein JSS20_06650 [Proteobacteria bacterium]|nr:hypothetical protein [Pseudomonadota bacterium]
MGTFMQGGGLSNLAHTVEAVSAMAERDPKDEDDLVTRLEAIYAGLFHADFSDYDVDDVRKAAPSLIRDIFDAQLQLRSRIQGWAERGLMGHRAQAAVRDVFRVSRYARDLLAEIRLHHPRMGKGDAAMQAFTGEPSSLNVNPKFDHGPLELLPGDVILQRGLPHNSAAIARIGDVDSQFSHISIVGRSTDGAPVMVEALIEEGSIKKPLAKALEHGVGRAILFRHRDPHLAERASELIREHIERFDGNAAPIIAYDFSMELGAYHELYCAKLVRLAYSMASTGGVQLPTYRTRLVMHNRDFVRRIGVTAAETFAPGDIELEPDFDLVAEWADYRVTSELRLKDMIMTKLFAWMDQYGYTFHETPTIEVLAQMGHWTSFLPKSWQEVTRHVVAKVPPNMTTDAIGAVAMLHFTGQDLFERLRALEDDSIRTTGRQLHPRDVLDQLEAWREEMGDEIGYLRRG